MPEIPSGRRRQPLDSLATKIILLVFASTLATAMVVSSTSIHSTHAHLSGMVDHQYPAALARARTAVQAWIEAGAAELGDLAGSKDRLDAADLERSLAVSNHFEGLILRSAEGDVETASGQVAGGSIAAIRLDPNPKRVGLQAIRTFAGSRATILSVPVGSGPSRSGTLIGVFRSSEIETLLLELRSGLGESVLLAAPTGEVVHGQIGPGQWIPQALLHDAAAQGVHDYTNTAGVHLINSVMPLGLWDWHIAVEAPFDVVFEPVVSVVKRIFVVDICVILLFSFLAYKITSAIVKPIEVLSDGARRIAQGQLDLEIPEPSTQDEIGLLTRTFNDMMRKLRGTQSEIQSANATLLDRNVQLRQANEVLEQLSITDGLTKLHNHRFFQDHLTREIKRVNRVKKPLSMILVDIDDFKGLNDRMGHAAGDELLRRIARLMEESIRESDLLARYGGEEFVVLASDTDLEGARQIAEKIRTAIAESSFILDDSLRPTRTTVSMGVAQYNGNRKQFFSAADRALYQAKADGKNCVVGAEDVPAS